MNIIEDMGYRNDSWIERGKENLDPLKSNLSGLSGRAIMSEDLFGGVFLNIEPRTESAIHWVSKLNEIESLINNWNDQNKVTHMNLSRYIKGFNLEYKEMILFDDKLRKEAEMLEEKLKGITVWNDTILREINDVFINFTQELNEKIEEFGFTENGKFIRAQNYSVFTNIFIEIFSHYENYIKKVSKIFTISQKKEISSLISLISDRFLSEGIEEKEVNKWKRELEKIRKIRNSLNHKRESVPEKKYRLEITKDDIIFICENVKKFLIISREYVSKKIHEENLS